MAHGSTTPVTDDQPSPTVSLGARRLETTMHAVVAAVAQAVSPAPAANPSPGADLSSA